MSITLTELVSSDRNALVDFLVSKGPWPFHGRPRPTTEQIEKAWDDGAYTSQTNRTCWLVQDGDRIGVCAVSDLSDDTPMLDLRIVPAMRGRGLGVESLRTATAWVFDGWPHVRRFEGSTRADNLAMRKTFERCGFVREAYYRQGWPSSDDTIHDAVGYAILRTDWESGTTTPIP